MTVLLALAQARAAQATADLDAAVQVLLKVMKRIDPAWPPLGASVAEAISWWSFEARLEHPNCPRDLADAYAAFRRAARAEINARRAVHRTLMAPAPAPAAKPARRTRKKKVTFADHVRALLAEEAARVAA